MYKDKRTESSQATRVDIEDEQIPPVQALGFRQSGMILCDTEMILWIVYEKYKSSTTSFSRKNNQLHKHYNQNSKWIMQADCWRQIIVFLYVKISNGRIMTPKIHFHKYRGKRALTTLPATRSLGPSLRPAHDTMINASVVAWNQQITFVNLNATFAS